MKKILALLMIAAAIFCVSCTRQNNTDVVNPDEHNHTHTEDENTSVEDNKQQNGEEIPYEEDYANKPSKKEIEQSAAAALEVINQLPEYPAGYPTLDDVVDHYNKANEAIGWIIGTSKISFDSNDIIKKNGLTYHRVRPEFHLGYHQLYHHEDEISDSDKLIYNLETLEAYLCTLINPEEVREYMLDNKELMKFTEGQNGALYAIPFSYIPQGYSKDEDDKYSLVSNGDGSYTFTVDYSLVNSDGTERKKKSTSFDFVNIGGRWVFDDFQVLKQ